MTCKWSYLSHESRWDDQFFRKIGLGVLADEQFRRIGTEIVPGGTRLAAGLTAEAAADLGLTAVRRSPPASSMQMPAASTRWARAVLRARC